MDVLYDMLRSLKLNGCVFYDAELTTPWCVDSQVHPEDCAPLPPQRHLIGYHYVCQGAMRVVLEGETVHVAEGELVVMTRNDPHILASVTGPLVPVNDRGLIDRDVDGGTRLRLGGGGSLTRILCGFLGTNDAQSTMLALLPPVLKLDLVSGAVGPWIENSMRYAIREIVQVRGGMPEAPGLLAKLAEVLFIEAVRRYVEAHRNTSTPRWVGALHDPAVVRALGLLHGEPERRWTTEELARSVGLSRSAFADHFVKAVGEPPMQYLTRRRIEVASLRLGASRDAIAAIAYEVGYESEAAFSRAFRRETGTTPAAFRRAQASPTQVDSLGES